MATDREIHTVSRNPTALRTLAASLLNRADAHNDWEAKFLADIAEFQGDEPASYRQAEKLLQIRDDSEELSCVHGFSIASMVEACWQARYDLPDDDSIDFIERLYEEKPACLRRRAAYRLFACASRIEGLIDGED